MGLKQAPKGQWYEQAADEALADGSPEAPIEAPDVSTDSSSGPTGATAVAGEQGTPVDDGRGTPEQQEPEEHTGDATVVPMGTRAVLSVVEADPTMLSRLPVSDEDADYPVGVRRVVASKRGKRDYNYSWPKEDLSVMRKVFQQYVPQYRRFWTARDPEGNYRLTFSPFAARALEEAFQNPDAWLSTVRNDARKQPLAGGREQVGMVWPAVVEEEVVDLWETLDRDKFPDGFSLTKQHLAAAAILHGLLTVEDWYPTVANDDRFSVPVRSDGRLRENKKGSVEDRAVAP